MSGLATIIMPFYNLAHRTLECLASVAQATIYEPVRLIIIDNHSEPGQTSVITDYLQGFPLDWQYRLQPENRGWVGGCIAGYEAMDPATEWVVLLNNDTVLSRGWLTRMIKALEGRPRYGIMGCVSVGGGGWQQMDRLQERKWIQSCRLPDSPDQLEKIAVQLRGMHGSEVRDTPGMVAFFCTVLRQTMLQQIGFLDPRFGLGLGDDDDLCKRARFNHWKIGVVLDVPVWHWHRSTFSLLAAGGLDIKAQHQKNMAYLRTKNEEVTMGRTLQYLGNRETHHPYIMHVPARDLTPLDMLDLEEKGWTEQSLCRTGLYVPVSNLEVQPFCGAPTNSGEPCKRPVDKWGERCWQHIEMENDDD